jgi:hypothetical protein
VTIIPKITYERSQTPEVTVMPPSNLYLITTDNLNVSRNGSDTYHPEDDYPLNQDKIWQIHIPKGCKMSVHFSTFDLEVSDKCEKDYFTVQTRKYENNIHKYCNNLNWIELRRINRVQMKFHSNHAVARGGIKAVACLSNLHDPIDEGELTSRLPCTCDAIERRRRKKSQSRKYN